MFITYVQYNVLIKTARMTTHLLNLLGVSKLRPVPGPELSTDGTPFTGTRIVTCGVRAPGVGAGRTDQSVAGVGGPLPTPPRAAAAAAGSSETGWTALGRVGGGMSRIPGAATPPRLRHRRVLPAAATTTNTTTITMTPPF